MAPAVLICFSLLTQEMARALSLAEFKAGSSIPARMAMIAIWLRSDFGFYLLILAYFSEMFSWFLENPVEDFWIYRIKFQNEDIVQFDGFLWFDRKAFRYDLTIKNLLCCLTVLYLFLANDKANNSWFRNWLEDVLPRLSSTPASQIDSLLPPFWKPASK